MIFFSQKLLGHEIFMFGPLGYKMFSEKFEKSYVHPSYLLNIHSLKLACRKDVLFNMNIRFDFFLTWLTQ